MKLPNYEEAHVPKRKITEYLLVPSHEDAQAKAPFFLACGFRTDAWEVFAERLIEHAATHPIASGPDVDKWGASFTVEGPLHTPSGERTTRSVRSVWIIEHGKDHPRLVSAFPID